MYTKNTQVYCNFFYHVRKMALYHPRCVLAKKMSFPQFSVSTFYSWKNKESKPILKGPLSSPLLANSAVILLEILDLFPNNKSFDYTTS